MNYKEALNTDGMCVRCKEWCNVAEPCCGAGVASEGHIYHFDDIEDLCLGCNEAGAPEGQDLCVDCAKAEVTA